MSDDLPNQNNDPPNPWETPQNLDSDPSNPSIPPDPSNNTVDPVQSWVAQHEQRDAHGHFVKSEHLSNGQPSQNTPGSSNTQNDGGSLPSPISITENTKYSEKNDPPMVAVSVTNPVTYLKKWVGKFLKNQDIDLHLRIKPFATIGLVLAFGLVGGTSYKLGFDSAVSKLFPNSSPILHRSISLQGVIQKSETGQYYLTLPDNTLWTLKPTNNNISLNDYINRNVVVKGNLTSENNVIEVKEVISFDKPTPVIYTPTQHPATNSAQPTY